MTFRAEAASARRAAVAGRAAALGARARGLVSVPAALALVVALGAGLRLTGVDWDDGAHLNPDERYVTMVADAVEWPRSPAEYFDVGRSPLSPYATETGRNYLYGQLPLVATKAAATAVHRDVYDGVHLVGRVLSALVDSAAIVLVFAIARLLLAGFGSRVREACSLSAAAFYALSVTAIQHAHFFTMESWLVATTLTAFLLAARLVARPHADFPLLALAATGGALGLTAATKVSGLLVAFPVGVAAVASALRLPAPTRWHRALALAAAPAAVGLAAYVAFRLVSPYAFEHSSWLRVEPNSDFRSALEAQRSALAGEVAFPPAYQWLLSTPWLDPLRNLLVWGVGPPLGALAMVGLAVLALTAAGVRSSGGARPEHRILALMVVVFVGATFAYVGSLFAHSLRYLLPVVPFLGVAAAYGAAVLARRSGALAAGLAGAVMVATLLYALAFTAVYRAPNTRIAASQWLLANVPRGATVGNEHWDDGLPVRAPPERFQYVEVPVFDPDDETKLRKLYDALARVDVYVLSSPRAWNSIGRLPKRFPLMVRFYERLRAERLGFREAARFESPPRLLGVRLDDLPAEESFWVYDHPPVLLFRREGPLSWKRFRSELCTPSPSPSPPAPGCP